MSSPTPGSPRQPAGRPDSTTCLRRLLPDGGQVDVGEAFSGLKLATLAPPERPYVVLNMVASVDGKATLRGRTAGLGSAVDRALFHALRTQSDAVMAGATTVREEGYGRIVRDEALAERRRAEGLAPQPLAVIPTTDPRRLAGVPLLDDPQQPVAVITGSAHELAGIEAAVEYVRVPVAGGRVGEPDLGAGLARLRREHGVRSVLCEGGPTLNSSLLRAGLVDELFLCLAPKLVGGAQALTIVAGDALEQPAELDLVALLEVASELFLRMRVRGADAHDAPAHRAPQGPDSLSGQSGGTAQPPR